MNWFIGDWFGWLFRASEASPFGEVSLFLNKLDRMICTRCGATDSSEAAEKYFHRTGKAFCDACRAVKRYKLRYGGLVCWPWHGYYDDEDNPLTDDFKPYLPGVRICHHRDCVNPEHVEGAVVGVRKRGRPAKPVDEDALFVAELLGRKL